MVRADFSTNTVLSKLLISCRFKSHKSKGVNEIWYLDHKITMCSCELNMSVIAVLVRLCLQEQLYKISCHDDARFDHFLQRVWSLLRRYQVRVHLKINTVFWNTVKPLFSSQTKSRVQVTFEKNDCLMQVSLLLHVKWMFPNTKDWLLKAGGCLIDFQYSFAFSFPLTSVLLREDCIK